MSNNTTKRPSAGWYYAGKIHFGEDGRAPYLEWEEHQQYLTFMPKHGNCTIVPGVDFDTLKAYRDAMTQMIDEYEEATR